jgi:hypothetical protein
MKQRVVDARAFAHRLREQVLMVDGMTENRASTQGESLQACC